MGRVLTLVIAPDSEDVLEDSIEAANFASREHPCRVIAVLPGDREAADPRLDAEIRVGADAGAGEVVVLRLAGELADHAEQRGAALPVAGHAGGGLVARGRAGDRHRIRLASWRFAASPTRRTAATRWRRSRAGSRAIPQATPIWPGAASPTGVHCWRRRLTRRRSSRSTRRWCRDSRRARARHSRGLVGKPDRRPGPAGGR